MVTRGKNRTTGLVRDVKKQRQKQYGSCWGGGWENLYSKRRENIEGNDLAYRRLRAGKKSLKHVGRSHTCKPFWQVLEMLSLSLILPAETICKDSPQAGFV